jgi:hypothetical protein
MTISHVNHCVSQLHIGAPEGAALPTLSDWGVDEAAVLAIPERFTFDAEGTYCPLSDVPDFICDTGVFYSSDGCTAYVAIDNGMSLAVFRLSAV